jgi:hypothetical protein
MGAALSALITCVMALSAPPAAAQLACQDITIPDGAAGAVVRGHSGTGPRCFEFTPGDGRAGTIAIVEGNGTLVIEGVAVDVKRHNFDPGPWTYYITITPEPFGSAGGPFALQVSWR